jgi:hypothetical protein
MAAETITDTNTAGLCPAPQRPTKKQAETHTGGREAIILQALRDLMHAVEMAEDNDYSPLSRKLLAATADRAADLTFQMPGRRGFNR